MPRSLPEPAAGPRPPAPPCGGGGGWEPGRAAGAPQALRERGALGGIPTGMGSDLGPFEPCGGKALRVVSCFAPCLTCELQSRAWHVYLLCLYLLCFVREDFSPRATSFLQLTSHRPPAPKQPPLRGYTAPSPVTASHLRDLPKTQAPQGCKHLVTPSQGPQKKAAPFHRVSGSLGIKLSSTAAPTCLFLPFRNNFLITLL